MHAVAGRHLDALEHYREALKLARSSRAPDVVFQYYTQCMLESLERLGHYDEVEDYCRRALAQLGARDARHPVVRRMTASHLERLGAVQAKRGDTDAALETLDLAIETAGSKGLTVATRLSEWLRRRMTLDAARITQLQEKSGQFTVDRSTLRPDAARYLDAETPARTNTPNPRNRMKETRNG